MNNYERKNNSPKNFAIGIDIGTMNGRVSVFRDGKVEIIPHGTDLRAIPCCVAFTDTNEHIGNDAKKLAETNPENVIFNVKRFIGREFHETSVQNDIKRVPFHVKDDKNGRPQIQVAVNGKMKGYYPEKLSSMVFDQMKKRAGTHLNCSVKDAVITVPAYFTDFQRQATKNAATSAGLNVLRIINEPTAAAIAYGLDIKDKRTILFFDLGAGAFDASIITCDNGTIEVKATVGDSHYGSEDFDNRIVNHFVNEFENTHEKDLASNPRALSRLRVAAELAKHTLSSETVADVNIESLFEDTDFNTSLSRDQFELICADLFQKPKKQLRALLVDAEMKSADIDEIVTIGCGSLPKIDDLIKEVFTGISINKPINHEELVVCGAAIQAAVLSGVEVDGFKKVSDILNFTLGVKSPGSRFIRLIERKTRIPVQVAMKFHPEVDYQPFLTITVLEEHGVPQKVLGDINYALIPQTPRVVPRVEVIFEVDADGVLVVSLRDVITRVLTSVSTRFKDHSVIEEEGQAAEPVQ
uniref:Heat shock protein 70 family n=1 Tax=Panagrellus redivivus TaxID=6233 RepID=A0A7E4ZY68_PANRE